MSQLKAFLDWFVEEKPTLKVATEKCVLNVSPNEYASFIAAQTFIQEAVNHGKRWNDQLDIPDSVNLNRAALRDLTLRLVEATKGLEIVSPA